MNEKMKFVFIAMGLFVVILIVGNIATSGLFSATHEETIKIGGMFVLSGAPAVWGEVAKDGVEIAIKEENENGGINGKKIEVIYEDTKGNPSDTVNIYNKLSKIDEVIAILGPTLQGEVDAIAPLAKQDNIPIMAITSGSNMQNYDHNPIFMWQDPEMESATIAEYAYNNGMKRIALLTCKDPWEISAAKGFKEKFEELGEEIVYEGVSNIDDSDVRTIVSKALEKNPDAIMMATFYQYLNYSKLISEYGYKGKVYGIEIDNWLAENSKELDINVEFVLTQKYSDEFAKKYKQTYGKEVSVPAGQAYDATKILIELIRKSENENRLLLDVFKEFKEYDGISGKIQITKDNKTIFPFVIYKLHKGEVVEIQS